MRAYVYTCKILLQIIFNVIKMNECIYYVRKDV